MPEGKSLAQATLNDIWARSISGDEAMAALGLSVDGQRQPRVGEIPLVLIWARLDEIPDDVLAECAYELHVEGYSESLTRSERENLVKESVPDHSLYATPYGVKKALAAFLGAAEGEGWEYRSYKSFRTAYTSTGSRTLSTPINRGYVDILIDSDLVRTSYPSAIEARAAVLDGIKEIRAEHMIHRISFIGFYTGWSCTSHDRV